MSLNNNVLEENHLQDPTTTTFTLENLLALSANASQQECQLLPELTPLLSPPLEELFLDYPLNYQIDNMFMPGVNVSNTDFLNTTAPATPASYVPATLDFLNWNSPVSNTSMPSPPLISPVDMQMNEMIPMMITSSNSSNSSVVSKMSIQRVQKKHKEETMDRSELIAHVEDKRRRNTESARRSRVRKALRLNELEQSLEKSEQRVLELERQVAQLLAEKQQWIQTN